MCVKKRDTANEAGFQNSGLPFQPVEFESNSGIAHLCSANNEVALVALYRCLFSASIVDHEMIPPEVQF